MGVEHSHEGPCALFWGSICSAGFHSFVEASEQLFLACLDVLWIESFGSAKSCLRCRCNVHPKAYIGQCLFLSCRPSMVGCGSAYKDKNVPHLPWRARSYRNKCPRLEASGRNSGTPLASLLPLCPGADNQLRQESLGHTCSAEFATVPKSAEAIRGWSSKAQCLDFPERYLLSMSGSALAPDGGSNSFSDHVSG